MSMRSTIVDGYGFVVSDVIGLQLLNFILNHEETVLRVWDDKGKRVIEELKKVNINDILQEDEDIDEIDNDKYEDLYYALSDITEYDFFDGYGKEIIAAIISNESGVDFCFERAQSDCIGYPSILFVTTYPWNLNDFEKTLDIDKLDEILAPYMTELNIDTNDSNRYGYLEVEYYG